MSKIGTYTLPNPIVVAKSKHGAAIDISDKECRDALAKRHEVPDRVSTRISGNAYLISGDV